MDKLVGKHIFKFTDFQKFNCGVSQLYMIPYSICWLNHPGLLILIVLTLLSN
jgi:hypothetical protein